MARHATGKSWVIHYSPYRQVQPGPSAPRQGCLSSGHPGFRHRRWHPDCARSVEPWRCPCCELRLLLERGINQLRFVCTLNRLNERTQLPPNRKATDPISTSLSRLNERIPPLGQRSIFSIPPLLRATGISSLVLSLQYGTPI